MSQENVEIVRRAFEAWNAWDMGAFRELYDAEVILRTPKGWPEPGPFAGLDRRPSSRRDAGVGYAAGERRGDALGAFPQRPRRCRVAANRLLG